ncbi:50S ribosomal protein L5 [Candidatus Hodgkinia cicadicola]|uniref:50S ribosomal protein L5 n=1 Tax=Candidatus Hodgkinia cicadicola TaxID=573658 RepID=A0ABX4MG97_9HYPH|nr:50S ribosomal protein L5 [Candidatus Hodgkinia cicadicola]PIM96119.1 50S ribosomal protein L5 [Candidatus Hodgkinia cicadicola]
MFSSFNRCLISKLNLKHTFGIKNIHMLPKIKKIILSGGINNKTNKTSNKVVTSVIHLITGLKPVLIKAKSAISGFKVKKHQVIGFKVTLRSKKLYNFLDKLIYSTNHKIKDFKGFNPSSFDKNYNISFGIQDWSMFSETLSCENVGQTGFNITICISALAQTHVVMLLKEIGLNFVNI